MADSKNSLKNYSGPGKWLRMLVIITCALLIFYIGVNFRVIVIPDYYVVLHPFVLPGQNWVYRRSNSYGTTLEPGDLILFDWHEKGEKPQRHISHLIGLPGQTVEYLPRKEEFKVNSKNLIQGKLHLSDDWRQSPYEKVILGSNEYLFIDNNTNLGAKKFWVIEKDMIRGKFLFQLPF